MAIPIVRRDVRAVRDRADRRREVDPRRAAAARVDCRAPRPLPRVARRQEQINLATGACEAAIAQPEGNKQAEINKAQGEAAAILARAEATAKAIRQIADAIGSAGGLQAVNLRIAEQYISEFGKLAKTNNTAILPTNVADVAGLIATAMSVVKAAPPAAPGRN